LRPEALGPADVELLRAAGIGDAAIRDALYVGVLFNIVDRIADALGFAIPAPGTFARAAGMLLKRGYR
jgi:alkylhydroperoxidase family enzyme